MTFKFELGREAKDLVTNTQGILVARAECLNGCNRYTIEQPTKDGKIPDSYAFDEARIELIPAGKDYSAMTKRAQEGKDLPGGPTTIVPRADL